MLQSGVRDKRLSFLYIRFKKKCTHFFLLVRKANYLHVNETFCILIPDSASKLRIYYNANCGGNFMDDQEFEELHKKAMEEYDRRHSTDYGNVMFYIILVSLLLLFLFVMMMK